MKFDILTLFPDMFNITMDDSIIGKAKKDGIIKINTINIRDYAKNKHKKVDDYPYGGGPGMVMQVQPIFDAYKSIVSNLDYKPEVIYLTPQGKQFNHNLAEDLSNKGHIILLCGHYEGVDERVLEEIVTSEISIGDYVLTGGELAAMVVVDAVSRLVPGVLSDGACSEESFSTGMLEYPQYTRPEVFNQKKVPEVLLSGHHANIDKWRREQSLIRTYNKRPDLLKSITLTQEEQKFLEKIKND